MDELSPGYASEITEEFDCDQDFLWRAWTEADAIIQWLGPPDWPAVDYQADLRVGGEWHATLRSVEDGTLLEQGGEFLEIDEPTLLRFSFRWLSENHEDGPGVATVVEIRLSEVSPGRTRMTLLHSGLVSAQSVVGHTTGWRGTFQRLATLVAQLRNNENNDS